MNENVKRRWVEALRSGKYEQGHGALRKRRYGSTDEYTYCCLGVLCELAADEGVVEHGNAGYITDPNDPDSTYYMLPPPAVWKKWAGLSDIDPAVYEPSLDGPVSLTFLNDTEKWTFEQIATAIEEHL